ncbi:MAG: hypothetical protein HDR24_01355 [Lachnospiraceae bacterium]|nr:hypothetical protein [Lachnospiraceae bacterium]
MNQVMRWMLKCETLSDKFLSEEGVEIENFGKVRLMGDSDVHYLMKNLVEGCAYVREYYDRNQAQGVELEKYKVSLEIKNRHVMWMKILEEFAANQGIDFDFQIIYTNQFNSGFRKQEFGNIELIFPELKNHLKKGNIFISFYLTQVKNDERRKVDMIDKMFLIHKNMKYWQLCASCAIV